MTTPQALQSDAVQTPARVSLDRTTAHYFALIKPWAVYVKQGGFFRDQGGLEGDWGLSWIPIDAPNMADAYVLAERLKAKAEEAAA